jgi:hypothetical protein
MKKATRISDTILYIILVISLILTVLMIFGGNVPGDPNQTPAFTDTILKFAYFLIFASVATAVLFELVNSVLHPRNAKKTLLSTIAVSVVLFIGFMMADGTPLKIVGYDGADNVPSMLLLTDTGLYAFYILLIMAVLAIVVTEIIRLVK